MTQRMCSLALRPLKELTPGVATRLQFQYENTTPDQEHILNSLKVDPTWDDETILQFEIGQSVAPEETFTLSPIRLGLPEAIGPKPGVILRVDIESAEIAKALKRVPVTNTHEFSAFICGADNTDLGALVYRVLNCWGFDIDVVDDQRQLTTALEADSQPIMLVGILPSGEDTTRHTEFVTQAVETADAHDTFDYVFAPSGIESPDLPSDASLIRVNSANSIQFETEIAPDLLGVREVETDGFREEFLDCARNRGKAELRDLLRAYLQNQVIRGVAKLIGSATAGAALDDDIEAFLEDLRDVTGGQRGPDTASTGQWLMRGSNPANTGAAQSNRGPTEKVTMKWRFETGRPVSSSPAVVNDTVYVGSFDYYVYALE